MTDAVAAPLVAHPNPLRSRRLVRGLLLALTLIAIVIGARIALHRGAPTATDVHLTPALSVATVMPRHAVWSKTIEASGSIAAWQEASVAAQISGYQLIDVRVNVGDQVKKGQILARLNPALLQAAEAQIKASRDQAEANRVRIEELKSSGAIADQDVLQYVTQAKTTQALLDANDLQLQYTDVLAPDDGAISSRTATLGAVVTTGQELFRLIRQNRLEWRGELTAAQLAHISQGQLISLSLPDGTSANAKVRITAPSLNPDSRLALVYADIVSGSSARSGMYANGFVNLGDGDALAAPAESVVIRDGRSYVLKIADRSETPRVTLQAVKVGQRHGDEIDILSGLSDQDRLVVQGAGFLNDGDVVRVKNAPTVACSDQTR